MKVLFISIYSRDTLARYLLSSYVLSAFLGKYSEIQELEISVLNFGDITESEKIIGAIRGESPDMICYSCYIWNIETVLNIIETLSDESDFIHVLGGPEITIERVEGIIDRTKNSFFVVGEGEKVLLELVNALYKEKKGFLFELPAGVAFRKNGEIEYTENIERILELDSIPSVFLENVIQDRLYSRQQAFIETQRGCIFKCDYCVYHKGFSSIAYFSLQRVFNEIEYLVKEKNVSAIRIFDAVFTSDLERAKKIVGYLSDLKKEGETLPWVYFETSIYSVDEEFITMVSSLKGKKCIHNCKNITPKDRAQYYNEMLNGYRMITSIGIQTFNKDSLKAVKRVPLKLEKLDWFMQTVNKHNIVLKIDFILGLPFESVESFFEGMEFFLPYLENTDHVLNIHLLQILPGSGLEKACQKFGIKYSKNAPHIIYETNSISSNELEKASKMTAILFRVVNSPFRNRFYSMKRRSGKRFIDIIVEIYDSVISDGRFADSGLMKEKSVYDEYWNDKIYKDISSEWLDGWFDEK